MINKDWSRWIKTSIRVQFETNKENLALTFDLKKQLSNEYVKVRINGPIFEEKQGKQYTISVDVNASVSVFINQKDLYQGERVIGKVESLFVRNIIIRDDALQMIGCLVLENTVTTTNFGKDHATSLEQAVVESTYKVTLQGD